MATRVWFNPSRLLLGTGFFAAGTAWLAFGPDTNGLVARVFGGSGEVVKSVAIACGMAMTILFAFHATRMALGLPALVASDHALEVHVLPVERFRWSEIDDVRIDAGHVLIVTRAGRSRRINLAMLSDCDAAIAQMREALAKREE